MLESPYTSTVDVAAWRFPIVPVSWLMKDRFESLARIGAVTEPVLVMHGESDPDVPVTSSETLALEQPDRVELHVVTGAGHVESWNYGPATYDGWVRSFLSPIAS